MANFEGLSLPAFGAGYHYAAGTPTTANWTIGDNGTLDLAVTTAAADNVFSVTHTASAAISSGYDQGVYVALNISSTSSGGNATQRNAFATDITINGVHASWIGGGYIYIAEGTATLTSAAVYGLNIDIQELGACDYLVNLWLQRSSSSTQTGVDAFILFSDQGSQGKATSLFYMQGIAFPTYFLQTASSAANGFLDTSTTFGTSPLVVGALKCYFGTTIYYIPLHAS